MYDEPDLLKQIEVLIEHPIQVLGPDLEFTSTRKYGDKKEGNPELIKHQTQLKPVVEQLSILETEAQKNFLNFLIRYKKKSTK